MIQFLILGLLKKKPGAYGYELLADMENNYFEFFLNFTKGSFYYNLQHLAEKQLIEKIVDDASDKREKNRYVLTAGGEAAFEKQFAHYGGQNKPITFPFYTPLLFTDQVEPTQMRELLQSQIAQTKEKIQAIEAALNTATNLQPMFIKMMANSKRHHEVDLEWLQEQLAEGIQ